METKKYEKHRIERKIPLFFLFGLNVALIFTIAAFEWKTTPEKKVVHDPPGDIFKDVEVIPITDWKVPQPPNPSIEHIKPTEQEPSPIEPIDLIPEPPKPTATIGSFDSLMSGLPGIPPTIDEGEIFFFVEEQPSFSGGWKAFYEFVGKNVKYTSHARRMGIEGKVFVEFVIEKDGSLTDIRVVKGLGAGLDEETIRVMNQVPNFNPGKQRGRPVRVKQMLPINFQLSK